MFGEAIKGELTSRIQYVRTTNSPEWNPIWSHLNIHIQVVCSRKKKKKKRNHFISLYFVLYFVFLVLKRYDTGERLIMKCHDIQKEKKTDLQKQAEGEH